MSELQTNPLSTPKSLFRLTNPVFGSQQNEIDKLIFSFPSLSANLAYGFAAKGAFAANQAIHSTPQFPSGTNLQTTTQYLAGDDDPDNPNPLYMFGNETLLQGMPIYGSLELGNTDPKKQNGNQYIGIDGNKYTFQNIIFPNAIVTANQPTNIVKTKITGSSGSIKQIIGLDDWNITINAVVTYPANQAPKDFISTLWQLKKAMVPIPVTNYYLNLLDVQYIIIEDIPFNQTEGGYSTQAVIITACSDIPLIDFLP